MESCEEKFYRYTEIINHHKYSLMFDTMLLQFFLNSLIYYEKEIWLESWEIFLKTMII